MAKILVVDDDKTMTGLLTTLLTLEGHMPMALNDSTQAIERAGSFNPELIILDLMMPGLSGFELCELLQQDPNYKNVPVIIVSARDDPASKLKARSVGAKDYMTKPFDADDLMHRINELLRTGSV